MKKIVWQRLVLGTIAFILAACIVVCCVIGVPKKEPLQPHSVGAEYSYANWTAKHDKAIIVIPGIMASAFYSTEDNSETWGMGRFVSIGVDVLKYSQDSVSVADKQAYFDSVFKSVACDENQVPYTKHRIANMSDKNCYDSFAATKSVIELLTPDYGDEYDLLTWQYDWRQHLMGAAEELEKFIETYKYKEVCFVTHSMGGAVVANYLSRSQANRDKVKLFVPFGAPFFGAFDSVNYLFPEAGKEKLNADDLNVTEIVSSLISGKGVEGDIIDIGIALINDWLCVDFAMTDLTRNIASVYQMLPNSALNDTPYYDSTGEGYVGTGASLAIDGKETTTEDFVKNYLSNTDWAKKENGKLKPVVDNILDYQKKFFFEKDGKSVFVTELVPTEYIVGIDNNTMVGAELNAKGEVAKKYKSRLGDSTIPAYSASAGLPLDNPRVHALSCLHNNLMDSTNVPFEATGMIYLLDICKKYL